MCQTESEARQPFHRAEERSPGAGPGWQEVGRCARPRRVQSEPQSGQETVLLSVPGR